MLRKTTHYELSKPDYNETADIEVVNSNMDIIDGALYELKEDLTVVQQYASEVIESFIFVEDFFVDSNGSITSLGDNSKYAVSEKIYLTEDVRKIELISSATTDVGDRSSCAVYDGSDNPISIESYVKTPVSPIENIYYKLTINVPDGAVYFRFSTLKLMKECKVILYSNSDKNKEWIPLYPQCITGYLKSSNRDTPMEYVAGNSFSLEKIVLKKNDIIRFTNYTLGGMCVLTKCDSEWNPIEIKIENTNSDIIKEYFYKATDDTEHLLVGNIHNPLYRPKATPNIIYKYDNNSEVKNSYLYGKHVVGLGDSYLANNGQSESMTWLSKLCAKYNCIYHNYGVNGSPLVENRTVNGSTILSALNRLPDITDKADIFILEGCENDGNVGTDLTVFEEGLHTLITEIYKKYPNTIIYAFTSWNYTQRDKYKPYAEKFEEVCNYYGIKCNNGMKNRVPNHTAIMRSLYYQSSSDSSHLNDIGHNEFLRIAEKLIN